MTRDWRMFRPAIWTAMVGIALILLVAPAFIGAGVLGVSIGIGARIQRRRRRLTAAAPTAGAMRSRRPPRDRSRGR